ncbi:hypothetical protein V5O48_012293 [Marasmius crinis-equi]|uniref:Uncharacterized protein n=1 Tax=Marasmius crinis-equi TaxID=585013 RepID=A0ABR3F364_9AGAR
MAGISFMSINARIFLSSETTSKSGFSSASFNTNPRYMAPYTPNSETTAVQNNYPINPVSPVTVTINHIVEHVRDQPSTGKDILDPWVMHLSLEFDLLSFTTSSADLL